MYQTIGEEIQVAGLFKKGRFWPSKFKWYGQTFNIQKITLTAEANNGGVKLRYYSVLASGNLYRLQYNRQFETWRLMEIWCEG